MKKIVTSSKQETMNFGKKFAQTLHGGQVLALYGSLGAGKTTLIKGIAHGFGIKKIITSPTFILMNVYSLENLKSKIQNFVHIDCYRIKDPQEIENIGALEYFYRNDTVTVVEWAGKISRILPKKRIKIFLRILKKNQRSILFS